MKRVACALVFCLLPLLYAADISGKWTGQMAESGRDVVFNLKADGQNITGTMSGAEGEPRPITKGELKDGDISLTIASEWQGAPVTLLAKGKVEGNAMKITLSSEGGDWSTEVVLKKAE